VFARYMQRLTDHGVTEKLHFIVGLGPLRSAEAATWMRDNLFGTIMPTVVIERMEAAHDPRQKGIEICAELMQQASGINGVSGAHLMAPGLHQEMVEAIGLAGVT